VSETEEKQHQEKWLQSGKTNAKHFKSGQALTWRMVGMMTKQDGSVEKWTNLI
jgi:hypothetical protein